MRILRTRKRLLAVSLIAVTMIGGGLAYGFWTGGGSGTGTASTGASTDFTVTSSQSTDAPLIPGGASQTVAFTVTNSGSGSQTLTNVAVSVAKADGTAWVATVGCSSADYTVGTPTITYGPIAGGAAVGGTVTIAMNNLTTNQDACQGVAAPLYFVAG